MKKIKNKTQNSKSIKIKIENSVQAVLLFSLSVLLFCLVIIPGENLWLNLHNFILNLFGVFSITISLILAYISVKIATQKTEKLKFNITILSILLIFSCSIFYVFSNKFVLDQNANNNWLKYIVYNYKNHKFGTNSGLIGALLGGFLVWIAGVTGARIISSILIFVSFMIITHTNLLQVLNLFFDPVKFIINKIKNTKFEHVKKNDNLVKNNNKNNEFSIKNTKENFDNNNINPDTQDIAKVTEKFLSKINKSNKTKKQEEKELIEAELEIQENELNKSLIRSPGEDNYEFPPLDLLNKSVDPQDSDISSELNNNGTILVETLKSFNVQTKIVDISRGPTVTRYELQPASGVKISKITTLSDDIALNLAASGVRIEAPIPGKSAVGIEIPNKVVGIVNMKELISSNEFKTSKSKLTVTLGRDISGEVVVADLAKMPHLLIAGSTGSGKSVCINSFIISLLYNARPSEVKLLMIDPKVVELGIYNGIPHLLVPVVTDARKAAGALGWAVSEMLKRYKKFAENNVRDLSSYNEIIENNIKNNNSLNSNSEENSEKLEKIPQIVIIIDELSDLMMAAPNEVEDYICRLAQMARAAGMYLVIATQRPSVDVITGIIKANIPSRIALSVSSQIDSRTILDMSGAEKLLGRGDMLFAPAGSSKPLRVQGCFVTDKEIEKVINFVKTSQESDYDDNITKEIEKNSVRDNTKSSNSKSEENNNNIDPVMKEAIKCVLEAGQASTSLLQRKLRLGYARAGRLIDEMEQMGIIGPHEGSKPRQVLINYQQFLELNINNN